MADTIVATSFGTTMRERNLSWAEQMIGRWDPNASSYADVASIFLESRDQARRFLSAVYDVRQVINSDGSPVTLLSVMDVAMKRLQKELRELLQFDTSDVACTPLSPTPSPDASSSFRSYVLQDIAADEDSSCLSAALEYARDVAECMIVSGYGLECVEAYKNTRRAVVEDCLKRLGIEHVSASQVQKLNWESLEFRINRWLAAARPLFEDIFPRESKLCRYIFLNFESIGDSCFAEIATDAAVEFLRFPSILASANKIRSHEKVFRYLDMYRSIRDLSPELRATFSSKSTAMVRSQADASLLKLACTIKSMIVDFESMVGKKDTSRQLPAGGGLDDLTQSVMNHLVALANHADILGDVSADEETMSTPSSMADRFARVIANLVCKLDVKADLYKDASQSYIFLTNNIQYVVNRAKESRLGDLLGAEWLSTHENKARSFARGYLRVAWKRVLQTIPDDPLALPGVEARGQRMVEFNRLFEEVCRKHKGWVVVDEKIGNEVKMAIARNLVGRYRPLYDICRVEMRTPEGPPAVVRFAPEDLLNYVSALFSCAYDGSSDWDWSSSSSSRSDGNSSRRSTAASLWRWLKESI